MQLHQLEYFLAVADALSFTRGAKRAHVVQSAVSAAIRQLERELDAELFERRPRQLRLSAAGEALVPRAREVVDAVNGARDAVDAVHGVVRGTVVLGTMTHLGSLDLAGVLRELHRDYPQVLIKLRQTIHGTRTSLEQVRSGELDLALVSAGPTPLPGIELYPLHAEPLLFVSAVGHWLADRPSVSLAETASASFIDFPEGWGNRAAVDRAFAATGVKRTIMTEVADFGLAIDLVRSDLGVAFLPESAVRGTAGIATAAVTDAELESRIQLATSAERATSAAAGVVIRAITGA